MRLMLWFCASTIVVIGLAVSMLYWSLTDHFRREDNAYVADKMAVIRHQLQSNSLLDESLKSTVVSDPLIRKFSRIYVRIDAHGQSPQMSTPGFQAVLGDPDPAIWLSPVIHGTDVHIRRIRGADRATYLLAASAAPGSCAVFLAYKNQEEEDLLADYRKWLIIVLGLASAVWGLIGYLLVHNGIRPLRQFTREIEAISSSSLHRRLASQGQPRELISLTNSFNDMLDRLEHSFQRISRFSSDIAHELRTPLHNMMGTVEVCLQKARPELEYQDVMSSILEEIIRLTRLVDKLLFLARSENPEFHIARNRIEVAHELQVLHGFYLTLADEAGGALPGFRARQDSSCWESGI